MLTNFLRFADGDTCGCCDNCGDAFSHDGGCYGINFKDDCLTLGIDRKHRPDWIFLCEGCSVLYMEEFNMLLEAAVEVSI